MGCDNHEGKNGDYKKYYGKYRGKVIENIDPLFEGRIIAKVPAIPGSITNFAQPCVPYAGPRVGFYAIPPIGANVWIEFEGGDPNFPIWSGCFWGPAQLPIEVPLLTPATKLFKTEFITLKLDDLPELGGVTLKCSPPAVTFPSEIKMDSTGITITCPESIVKMTPETITITVPESVVSLNSVSIAITVPPSSISVTPEAISSTAPPAVISMTPADIRLTAPTISADAATVVEAKAPAVNVTANVSMKGMVSITGNTNIAGLVTVV